MRLPTRVRPETVSDDQRRALCQMMYRAIAEIRALGWAGQSQQAANLADAFHNVPLEMTEGHRVNISYLRATRRDYQSKYGKQRMTRGQLAAWSTTGSRCGGRTATGVPSQSSLLKGVRGPQRVSCPSLPARASRVNRKGW